ncbi:MULTISPECIES: hypothetical protein [unclassified Wolbachia]|uniref:hypothetical protein n=1 Tax=unclassified Wolbachia TaxID=2640676 RepID=UPI001428A833|nr:hypothetical protein [Wolbachia endosymbiont of Nomada flava]
MSVKVAVLYSNKCLCEIAWKTGSQCLGTGMTSSLMKIALKSRCSYSCVSRMGMTKKGALE